MIARRGFIAAGVLGFAPLAGQAQPTGKVPRIGILFFGAAPVGASPDTDKGYLQGLRELGYVEGQNIQVERRYGQGRPDQMAQMAAELVQLKVDVIVAAGPGPREAARSATRTIPIVTVSGADPVRDGWAHSLARPGGNVTGTSYWASTEIFAKHFQILKELAPRTDRVAVLRNANDAGSPLDLAIAAVRKRATAQLGMTVHYFDVHQPQDIPAALNAIAASGIKAMFYQGDPIMRVRTAEIMAFLRDQRMASIAVIPTFAEAGGLAHFSPVGSGFYERTASYVDRILRGAKPSDLPVEEPTKFEFVINLKTAKAIGLTIPQSALLRADRVIE